MTFNFNTSSERPLSKLSENQKIRNNGTKVVAVQMMLYLTHYILYCTCRPFMYTHHILYCTCRPFIMYTHVQYGSSNTHSLNYLL